MKYLPRLLIVGVGVGGIVAGKAGDAPGALLLGIALIVGAAAFYAPSARPLLAAAVGVAGLAAGLADDAPGAVLLGLLIISGAVALSMRSARRRPA